MKKKLLLLGTVLALSLGGVIYASCEYTTTCGAKFVSVSPDYFPSKLEYGDFIMDMNEMLCGELVTGGVITNRCNPK